MSIRLEMLQVARLAPKLLGDSTHLVREFLLRQQLEDGGFKDRDGRSDLYYTVFGLSGLQALQADFDRDRVMGYLRQFSDGRGLDFVHVCCLARCWAALGRNPHSDVPEPAALLENVERFRSGDGGYHASPGSSSGTTYGCFLALGAYQDLQSEIPQPSRLLDALNSLAQPDGGWANEHRAPASSTNATAAAITALSQFRAILPGAAGDWLLSRRGPEGGFRAGPGVPMPDLLSTATTLHALAVLERQVGEFREACLDFVDTLWSNHGGFHGHWADDTLDCEYTYYGLLALGHLSL